MACKVIEDASPTRPAGYGTNKTSVPASAAFAEVILRIFKY